MPAPPMAMVLLEETWGRGRRPGGTVSTCQRRLLLLNEPSLPFVTLPVITRQLTAGRGARPSPWLRAPSRCDTAAARAVVPVG